MKSKVLSLLLMLALTVSMFSGCSSDSDKETVTNGDVAVTEAAGSDQDVSSEDPVVEEPISTYEALDANIEGEITVMLWSGDGTYMEDVGHKDLLPEEIGGFNQAAAYATAKAFNEIYPNIKINVYAKADGPDDDNGSWAQHKENFKAEHGSYPDLFPETDIPGMIAKGLIADLSIFSDDPLYQTFNEGVMETMSFGDFQAALPQYLLPWGVFVNKSLAEDNNIDVPDPDWTIDEYTDFIASADMENFYGAMDTPFSFINTGSTSINYSLFNGATEDYVQLDSDEIASLVDYIAEWADYAVYPQSDLGNVPQEVMDENWSWGYKFFIENKILTNAGDPWMMGDAAHPDETHWGRAKAAEWDIYPRPATEYQPATVGIVNDPFAVYNYAMDDGDPAMSDEEYMKAKIAYTFAAFWTADTRSWEARANQQFLDGETLAFALNDSFPFVTGEEFAKQMDVWYSTPNHERFQDADSMPGFHYVLELWENGQFWDVSDKLYPWFHDFEGARRSNLYEFENMWNVDVAGAVRTEANWADNVKARLAEWDDLSDERFAEAHKAVEDGLAEFYNK